MSPLSYFHTLLTSKHVRLFLVEISQIRALSFNCIHSTLLPHHSTSSVIAVMPARQRSALGPEPITKDEKHSAPDASSPQASSVKGATKKDIELWHSVIQMVETQIAKETNVNRVENMRAVLAFIQEHGYPDGDKCEEGNPEFCIWAMDGEVSCQTKAEFLADSRWELPPPGFKGRSKEGYSVGPPRRGH